MTNIDWKSEREKRQMTVQDVVHELWERGYSTTRQAVYNWEGGQVPHTEYYLELCQIFNLDPYTIIKDRKPQEVGNGE